MSKQKLPPVKVETFDEYQIITPPNPLRAAVRRVDERDMDDPVARAEQALAAMSGEFTSWMVEECERLATAHAVILRDGFSGAAREELFRAAHDIKGGAATFGFAAAGTTAESLCRIIEHAPDLEKVPAELITQHINAIQAIVREQTRPEKVETAERLSQRLRSVADEYLIYVNRDRPEHLEAVTAPSIVPGD
ncbi:Hpt domain-containing protein [Afipia sp. TerB]